MKNALLNPNPDTQYTLNARKAISPAGYLRLKAGTVLLLTVQFIIPAFISPVVGQCSDEQVVAAYELRINGKFDEARSALEKILENDPECAIANFEMARLIESANPLATGEIVAYCEKAQKAEPGNPQYAYYRAKTGLLEAYIAMHQGNDTVVSELLAKTCSAFNHVIELDPGCVEARLYLVDIYTTMPPEMGGDRQKAVQYVNDIEGLDKLAGARARLMLDGESGNPTEFWLDYIKQSGESVEAMKFLGKAYLMEDNIDEAVIWFDKVLEKYPGNDDLYLDLARGHIYRVMQNESSSNPNMEKAEYYLDKYLDSQSEKPVCTEAWCYGVKSRLEMFMQKKEESEKSVQKATELCPTFSRAMAVPKVDDPPNAATYAFSSFFRPF